MKKNWKITGIAATIFIVMAFPLYVFKAYYIDHFGSDPVSAEATFVGSNTCIDCHKLEYDLWLQSDHYFAMDTASASSVLGDFNNAELERNGETHKFYKKGDRFFVYTTGPEGKMEEFEVQYTFGAWPLQQYLVPFPDGKFQTLALTWDTITKQWYHMADSVYPGQEIKHDNWLHWTNQAQNWNGMCADCHSTNLKKGYDPVSKTFHTTYSEINVGCEACHGPSSEHLIWAELPELARPLNTNFGLVVQSSNIDNNQYVDLCARCHARRSTLEDYDFAWHDLYEHMIVELPRTPNYYKDGQILNEDYVFGSFVQSKMFMNDVQCNDCHNVHSGKLVLNGNDLCLQCHRADEYNTYNHHFHKQKGEDGKAVVSRFGDVYEVGEGALCINCHMTGQYYMGVDYRRDHSFRIPRPDLSMVNGSPNACTDCHGNENNQWAASYTNSWYGKSKKTSYGSVLAAAYNSEQPSLELLTNVASDELYPPILRATALSLITEFHPDQSAEILSNYFSSMETMLRYTAVFNYQISSPEDVKLISNLLYDPVKAIRIEAALKLSGLPIEEIPDNKRAALNEALEEYRLAMEYTADFAASRHNLGNFYSNKGEAAQAIENYLEAIRIDDEFFPAKVNLAMLYNRTGDNAKAESLLKDVLLKHPDQTEIYYSLGLLLAEEKQYDEALQYLSEGAELMPDYARIHYNLGQLLDFKGDKREAEKSLKKALDLEPENPDYLVALTQFYLKYEDYQKAKPLAIRLNTLYPSDKNMEDLVIFIDSKLNDQR